MNTENSSRGGSRINGATGATYKMRRGETLIARTVYYYAEIINTIDGKTGVTESNPCRVTFVDKNELQEKSLAMVDIPAGTVSPTITNWNDGLEQVQPSSPLEKPWTTPGFRMGPYLVTWELWKFVFDNAEAGNYRFSRIGNQGAMDDTISNPQPVGNELHPVTFITWRDAVVWCNAYSEMDGKEPVYRGYDGEPLRDSRAAVELLVDESKITGKNGYRLPSREEWLYAARGAIPSNTAPWTNQWPGTNIDSERNQYLWGFSIESQGYGTISGEVGSREHNGIGLYDMMGMVYQYLWDTALMARGDAPCAGTCFYYNTNILPLEGLNRTWVMTTPFNTDNMRNGLTNGYPIGLRIVEGGLQ
jgi:formylglycine-generating enzyme required for sulfatase activity